MQYNFSDADDSLNCEKTVPQYPVLQHTEENTDRAQPYCTKDTDSATEEKSAGEAMNITFGDVSGLFSNQVTFEFKEKTRETDRTRET